MYTINRSIAIIRIKQPFVDWANELPDAGIKSSLDDFKTDCLAVLIPDYDTDEDAIEYINQIYEDIFIEELYGWCTEEAWFPQDRTNEMFWQWGHSKISMTALYADVLPSENGSLANKIRENSLIN